MKLKLPPPDKRKQTCFGMHYSGIFKIIAIGECMTTGPYVLVFIIDYILNSEKWRDPKYNATSGIYFYLKITAWLWYILQITLSLLLNILLFRQSVSPNVTYLMCYSFVSTGSFLAYAIFLGILNYIGMTLPSIYIFGIIPGTTIYRFSVSYVVYRFALDIAADIQFKSGYRNLTNSEVESFENGVNEGDFAESPASTGKYSLQEIVHYLKYNRKEFEIPIDNLDFSEVTTLGFGEYGHVYKVLMKSNKGSRDKTKVPVAVKTVDPELSDVNHFTSLLLEAKLMTYLGKHEHVVELIGLFTGEIRFRRLYIVCELCALGNLRSYLRSERNTFLDLLWEDSTGEEGPVEGKDDHQTILQVEWDGQLSTKDLMRWSYEVACGMEFLASLKVVHGDLATRNVLLTEGKTAKITDFGLSRRLYNYSVYVRRKNVSIPWRALALESLVDMSFSVMSDVWSYGVCIWEIFELGGVPWSEFTEFTLDFIQCVKDGKRLGKPSYCPQSMYEIMLACWNEDRTSRPTFTDIANNICNIHI